MKLGIELSSGVGSEDVFTVRQICQAARRQGHEVKLFVMCDSIFNLDSLKDLASEGVEIFACSSNIFERRLPKTEGVIFGSQYDWAQIVHDSDRVIAFG